jgi:hypothetical protein
VNRAAQSFALSVMLSASFAGAADPPLATMRLDYRREPGAEACPDEQEFRDAMTARVHRSLFEPAAADRLVVRLQGRNGWYQGVAELRDATGAATWTVPLGPVPRDCSAIVDSLAFSTAIKVDPRGSKAVPASAPAVLPNSHRYFGVDGEVLPMPPPPSALPDAVLTPPSVPTDIVVMPPAAPERGYRIRLGASGGIALGAAAGFGPSFALDVGVRWPDRPLSLTVEAAFVPPASGDVPAGVHVTTYRATGAGVACGHFLTFLYACGIVQAGALHGTGTAMHLNAQSTTLFYGGLGGRGGAELPVGPHVALRISGDALVTIAQPVLVIGGTPVYRASLVSGTLGAGVVATF